MTEKLTDVTDNKVGKITDSEIIKALECCILGDCQGCFYGDTDQRHCKDDLMQNALDLINRQKAEIERLKSPSEMQIEVSKKIENTIKAEAYKEFADRLKNEIIGDTAYGCDINQHTGYYDYQIKIGDIPEYIDNLLKELVGEDK